MPINRPEERILLNNLREKNLNVLNDDVVISLNQKRCQSSTMIVKAFLDLVEERWTVLNDV